MVALPKQELSALSKLMSHSYRLQRRGCPVINGENHRLALPDSTHYADMLPMPPLFFCNLTVLWMFNSAFNIRRDVQRYPFPLWSGSWIASFYWIHSWFNLVNWTHSLSMVKVDTNNLRKPGTFFCASSFHPRPKEINVVRKDVEIIIYLGCGPLPVTVTTRIITFLVGDPYKPSFPTVTGRGPHPIYTWIFKIWNKSAFWEVFWVKRHNFYTLGRSRYLLEGGKKQLCTF